MTDDHLSTVNLVRERLERLSQVCEDLNPAHQELVQDVLDACSASADQLQAAAEERERLMAQSREDQGLLKELRAELEHERKIQKGILQHTEAHLAYLDAEFNFVRVNESYAQDSGHTEEDLIGRNHFDLFPHEENQARFEQVRDTGEPFRVRAKPFEFADQPERGTTCWDWTLEPAKDENGRVEGLILSLLDVTETVKVEQALREERDRAQGYLDIAGVIIVVIGSDETVAQINRRGCEILGCAEEEIVGRNWFDSFIPERMRERIRSVFRANVSGEDVVLERFENPILTQSGEERLIWWHNALLRDGSGKVTGALSSGEDITERRRAEEELHSLAHDLGKRVRELDCLYRLTDLVETPGISLEQICAGAVELIPPAWQHPEVACARIIVNGKEYSTATFAHSPWQQRAEILAQGEQIGSVEVGYLQEMPEHDQGPFLNEERELLLTIARRLGEVTERMCAHQQLEQQHRFVQLVLDSLPHPFYVINVDDYTVAMANQAARVGASRGEHTCYALAHGRTRPCDASHEPCPLREVFRTKEPVVVEHVHLDEGDRPRAVEVRGYPITDREGNVVQMIEYVLDITERKEAEQALRESEANWRSLTETSPDHILMLDTEQKIQFANFASPGLSLNELIGTPLYTLVDEQAQSEVRAVLETALATGTSAQYETVYHSPCGDDFYYESRVAPRKLSGSDEIVGLTVSSRDITERKHSEQALRDSEEKLRTLFEILPVGVSVLDESRKIRLANPAMGRILRLSHEQLLSGQYERRTYLRADGAKMQPDEFPTQRAFQEDRLVRDVEICVVTEDEERIWTSVSAVPLASRDWRIIATTIDITGRKLAEAALMQARDELEMRVEERTAALKHLNKALRAEIAERLRAEENLRASEERFRQLAENTEDIIWLMEPDSGQLLYISPTCEAILGPIGSNPPETIEQLWTGAHPDDRNSIPGNRADDWLGQEVEFRVAVPDGSLRWIRARAFPIRNDVGQIYRLGGIATDITEEKQAFAALIEAEQLAMAGRMAASLAHEINNPLQAAIGCLDLSLEQITAGKVPHQHLQVTAQALDRASRVVAQLRALHYPLETESRQPSDLNQLLQNMLLLTEKRCVDQGVEVDWQANADLPPVMLVPDAMEQVCLNLLLNALEAMPQGGRLVVGIRRTKDPDGIRIEVSDSGHGIPADELEHVFEPFYSTKPHSLGLGLFISHNIVLEHGGHMEVDSQEGAGTIFGIWLPLSEPEVEPPS